MGDEFARLVGDDELCAEVRQAVEGGDEDTLRRLGFGGFGGYAQRLSELMSDSVREGHDPQAEDFAAIMEEVARPVHYAHHLVNEAGTAVQRAKDEPLGIHMKPIETDFDDDALKSTVGNAASMDTPEKTVEALAEGLAYAVKKTGNDFIKANAEAHSRAGFEVKVKRSGSAKCCPWCAARIGSWAIANAPDGVFGCHANCSCTVEYTSSTGAKTSARGANLHLYGTGAFVEVGYEPPHVGAVQGAEKVPHRLTDGANGGIIGERSKAYNDLIRHISSIGIENNPVRTFDIIPSEEEIIKRLAGGDLTKGSCSSLALAYAGNKGGVDVRDFRGGNSCDFFSRTANLKDITKLDGVVAHIENNTNDFAAVSNLLKKTESGKEYILVTGKHTAVIKRTGNGVDFLEMQDPKNNGFERLTTAKLRTRFGCKKTHKSYGYSMQVSSILFDRQTLSDSEEFKKILGYINTDEDRQMKGVDGYEK